MTVDTDMAALDELLTMKRIPEDYVRFRMEVLGAQNAASKQLCKDAPSAIKVAEVGAEPPLSHSKNIPWDEELLRSLFDSVIEVTERRVPQNKGLLEVKKAIGSRPGKLVEFVEKAVYEPDCGLFKKLVRDLDTPLLGLVLLGRMLATPFFGEARRRLEGNLEGKEGSPLEGHTSGRCPMCGQPATLAKLRKEDGQHVLACGLCSTQWTFSRVTCSFCLSQDQDKLQVIYLKDDDMRWIATCDKCKRYVKSVDERKFPKERVFSFYAEDTGSLSLDLLAEQEGYVRPF